MESKYSKITQGVEAIQKVIMGQRPVIEKLFIALLAEGHVLLESVPGSGKTQLAKSFAKVVDGQFRRVQFTPDVLPSDVTGIQFFNPKTEDFQLRMGPVMSNILLADEINRATPKTQSSLLEVMEEKQTTIDGDTIPIEKPFIVIATQNSIESNQGTFPLPEAQLDRFLMKITMDYPTLQVEKEILRNYRVNEPLEELSSAILFKEDILSLQAEVKHVQVGEVVTDYLLQVVRKTREHPDVELGISTRGALALMRASQAKALIHGRNYVSPSDIKDLVPYIFSHRIQLTMEASIQKTATSVIENILQHVEVPVEVGERD
ncbi:AAA family ATPase [Salinibacillus xinjiangensis]|uniref:AAA domain-containing protein n=1 Tax=Salinibacillus xinjiangensis TaxID=1229268 RepID=A0A6G1X2C1_9BACI|nr:MoxR family ATPase [Salinibacillus xinjiangensis]MRG85133.1 AAA domain-containing protein [Salinibacillus xinjiangensis]